MSGRTNGARREQKADLHGILAMLADLIAARVSDRLVEGTDGVPRHVATPVNQPDFLTEPEAARRSSISVRTLQGWRGKGQGPRVVRAGRRVLYPRIDFESWLGSEQAEKQGRPPTRR